MRTGTHALHVLILASALIGSLPTRTTAQTPAAEELTDAQKEAFLLNAEIGRMQELSTGRTRTRRATLRDGEFEHDAHIQDIDDDRRGRLTDVPGGVVELNFRDTYKFNIAAYRLDRLIDLNMVPVSVERRVQGELSAVTWWVDDVLMMELERREQQINPPDFLEWNSQMYNAMLFQELVFNTDPNPGNQLITTDWRIYLIDFTRAFRILEGLRQPESFRPRVDRGVYDGLKALDFETVKPVMDGLLNDTEVRAILSRRDVIVGLIDEAIATLGEDIVFQNLSAR